MEIIKLSSDCPDYKAPVVIPEFPKSLEEIGKDRDDVTKDNRIVNVPVDTPTTPTTTPTTPTTTPTTVTPTTPTATPTETATAPADSPAVKRSLRKEGTNKIIKEKDPFIDDGVSDTPSKRSKDTKSMKVDVVNTKTIATEEKMVSNAIDITNNNIVDDNKDKY